MLLCIGCNYDWFRLRDLIAIVIFRERYDSGQQGIDTDETPISLSSAAAVQFDEWRMIAVG